MSSLEALYIFLNKPVSSEMVQYLVATTTAIICVQPANPTEYEIENNGIATPPQSPTSNFNKKPLPSLYSFIQSLIEHSHVQCTTLMTTLIYLNRLKQVIPPNSVGMATTHHRIFLGSLLLAAKYTNDSSPMNKHWTTYTNGLLSLREVNALEIEMIQYIGWDHLRFQNEDLIHSLSYFLEPIKRKLRLKNENKLLNQISNIKKSKSNLDLNSNIIMQTPIQYPIKTLQESDYELENNKISKSSTSSSLPSLISASSSTSTVSSYMSSSSSTRKDSVQSILSDNLSTSILNSPSQNQSIKKLDSTPISMSLRPLRLKPKQNQTSTIDSAEEESNPTRPNLIKRRSSSINLLSITPSSNSISNLKHSRKSLHLVNLNTSTDHKEQDNTYSDIDNNLTIVV
jgi:G1/S-specific cyclin PLC2